jgi:hypothetical protein
VARVYAVARANQGAPGLFALDLLGFSDYAPLARPALERAIAEFGVSPRRLAATLGCDRRFAQRLLDTPAQPIVAPSRTRNPRRCPIPRWICRRMAKSVAQSAPAQTNLLSYRAVSLAGL